MHSIAVAVYSIGSKLSINFFESDDMLNSLSQLLDTVSINWWGKANGWDSLQPVCRLPRLKSLTIWGMDMTKIGIFGSVRQALKVNNNHLVHLGLHGNSTTGPSLLQYMLLLDDILGYLPKLETLDISKTESFGVMSTFCTTRYVPGKMFVAPAAYFSPSAMSDMLYEKAPKSFVLYAKGFGQRQPKLQYGLRKR